MSAVVEIVQLNVSVTWPVRPNIDPFECGVQDKHPAVAALSFPPSYTVAPGVILNGISWTRVDFSWEQPFEGGGLAAAKWLSTDKAVSKMQARAEELSARMVQALRSMYVSDRNLAGMRNFGVRDWPYFSFGVAGYPENIRIGVHAESQFRSVSTQILRGRKFSLVESGSFPCRAIQRASDLAEIGYPTEASLIAFGALDAAVQGFLVKKLTVRGVQREDAEAMLRNITTKRISTYLTSVLTLAVGVSLSQDKGLYSSLLRANKARNDAIHNGVEMTRLEAIEVIDCVSSIFEFLQRVDVEFEPEFIKPSFFG
jgi:hypothetical protein